jgi:hypothetical protein
MLHNRFFLIISLVLFCTAPALFTALDSHAMPGAKNTAGQAIKGTVLETMNASGYTYILLKNSQEETWVAIPRTDKVEKGKEIACQPGMTMTDFKSSTLNRTFPAIIFSAGIVGQGTKTDTSVPPAASQDTVKYPKTEKDANYKDETSFAAALQNERTRTNINQKISDMEAQVSGGSIAAIVPAKSISIERATGENSYNIGESFSKRNELNNQKIRVRGKVVKVSKMIMGKNWVHLQDGTGNPLENTHNLVFTTQEAPELGSIVTMEGTLHADKDFGAGYKYKAIVEDAVIKGQGTENR